MYWPATGTPRGLPAESVCSGLEILGTICNASAVCTVSVQNMRLANVTQRDFTLLCVRAIWDHFEKETSRRFVSFWLTVVL